MICTQADVITEALALGPQFQPRVALIEKISHKYGLTHWAAANLVDDTIREKVIRISWSTEPTITGRWLSTGAT